MFHFLLLTTQGGASSYPKGKLPVKSSYWKFILFASMENTAINEVFDDIHYFLMAGHELKGIFLSFKYLLICGNVDGGWS